VPYITHATQQANSPRTVMEQTHRNFQTIPKCGLSMNEIISTTCTIKYDGDDVCESGMNSGRQKACERRRFWCVAAVLRLVGGLQHHLGGVDRHVLVVVGVVYAGPLCLRSRTSRVE
jgi:hypothetical protein